MQEPSISHGNVPQFLPPSRQRVRGDSQPTESMSAPSNHEDATLEPEIAQRTPKPSIASHSSPGAAMAPARSNTLSWQQRPSSRGSTAGRSRPLSMVASENNTARSPRASVQPSPATDAAIATNEITQSLGAKDAAFFRQTEDRGHGSAAYKRNQMEIAPGMVPAARAMRLPGMSRDTSAEPERKSSPLESVRSTSPSKGTYFWILPQPHCEAP